MAEPNEVDQLLGCSPPCPPPGTRRRAARGRRGPAHRPARASTPRRARCARMRLIRRLGDQPDDARLAAIAGAYTVFTVRQHYGPRTAAGLDVEGLPSRFSRLDRWVNGRRLPVSDGFSDTGDVIESS